MGFENIAAHHGWSQALIGASIVIVGLIILALAISQIHKLVDLWERRSQQPDSASAPASVDTQPVGDGTGLVVPLRCPADLSQTAALYKPLVDHLGQTFELKDLYRRAAEFNLPHPHITIKCLREAGILKPEGNGVFRWES